MITLLFSSCFVPRVCSLVLNPLFCSTDGDSWFTTREKFIGPVPLKGDLARANELIETFLELEDSLKSEVKNSVLQDLWEQFSWKTPWDDVSRVMFAIPRNWEETRLAGEITLQELKRRHHSVSLDWLEEHGECGDWITVKLSTIRQAGRGAFARKILKKGETVAPFPLIHLPYRKVLDMFELVKMEGEKQYKADRQKKIRDTVAVKLLHGP